MKKAESKLHPIQVVYSEIVVLRTELLDVEKRVRVLRGVIPPLANNPAVDMPELAANITLAFRHLEDSRMRLGKAIQALEGGVSIYDRPASTTPKS